VSIPPLSRKAVHSLSPWDAFGCAVFESEWLMDLQVKFAAADLLREKAKFNTGSISLETGLQLRALCHWKQPKVVVEIGTFIGKSTQALHADHIYTCDKDNDCVEATDHIKTHPYCTSTDMLTQLQEASVQVDLFFLDGRLTDADIPLIRILSKPDTVYVVDDYHEGGKGQANVEKLQPLLPNYGFVGPYSPFAGRSTLAMLVPFQL
jgi:predicted O-methyltransferase YrrM